MDGTLERKHSHGKEKAANTVPIPETVQQGPIIKTATG